LGFAPLFPSFSSVSVARTFWRNAAIFHGCVMGAVCTSWTTDIANATAQASWEAQGWQLDQAFYTCHF
jgi:hypothetical protein